MTGAEFKAGAMNIVRAHMQALGALARWAAGFFDATRPEQSAKRLAMVMATFTLCRSTVIMAKAIAHQIYQGNEVPQGTVYAFAALTVPVAAMAGVVYLFKKDGTIQGGAAPEDPKGEAR